MEENQIPEEVEVDYNLPADMRIHKASVPGGWVYITYVQRTENGKEYTSQLSTVYVPGRR